MRSFCLFLIAVLTVSATSACRQKQPQQDVPPLTVTVDAALSPVPAQMPDDGRRGARPLAVIRDEAGVESEFVANEVARRHPTTSSTPRHSRGSRQEVAGPT